MAHSVQLASFLGQRFVEAPAEAALRELPVEQQRQVLNQGPLGTDATQELLNRVREAAKSIRASDGSSSGAKAVDCADGRPRGSRSRSRSPKQAAGPAAAAKATATAAAAGAEAKAPAANPLWVLVD